MAVEILQSGSGGGIRILGVPTVADRVAQTVAGMALEARTESIFHDDSYGYRPRRWALDAVAKCRQRCWKKDWVIDLDVAKFFDSVPWDLMVKAVQANITTDQKWVLPVCAAVACRSDPAARWHPCRAEPGNSTGFSGVTRAG
jgi:RNA-directed DNA polymerase